MLCIVLWPVRSSDLTLYEVDLEAQTKNGRRGGEGEGRHCTPPYLSVALPSILSASLPTMLAVLSSLLFRIIPEQDTAVHVCTHAINSLELLPCRPKSHVHVDGQHTSCTMHSYSTRGKTHRQNKYVRY